MKVRPFKAIRPKKELAEQMCALPYDVMNRSEAKAIARDNPYSFLHISRSEIDLDEDIEPYDDKVYQAARDKFTAWLGEGVLVEDKEANYYIYQLEFLGHIQTGIVAAFSIDDYISGRIKKHELTRKTKERDRIKHFDVVGADTEPVFLAYKNEDDILSEFIADYIKTHHFEYDFTTKDGVRHSLMLVDKKDDIEFITNYFQKMDEFYIADGHHRSASAVHVGEKRRAEAVVNDGSYDEDADYNYFCAVIFADDELHIMDYNRLVVDINGLSADEFLNRISKNFELELLASGADIEEYRPLSKQIFSMYFDKNWYFLEIKSDLVNEADIKASLDAQLLQDYLLEPILGIDDPRTSERIDFIGGIRGLDELRRRVDDLSGSVAFAVHPVDMKDIFAVADLGETMPPKSTWFEPKLGSGLFVKKI